MFLSIREMRVQQCGLSHRMEFHDLDTRRIDFDGAIPAVAKAKISPMVSFGSVFMLSETKRTSSN